MSDMSDPVIAFKNHLLHTLRLASEGNLTRTELLLLKVDVACLQVGIRRALDGHIHPCMDEREEEEAHGR